MLLTVGNYTGVLRFNCEYKLQAIPTQYRPLDFLRSGLAQT